MSTGTVADRVLSKRAKKVSATLVAQTSISFEGVINLGNGTPEFPTPAHVVEAGKRALDKGYSYCKFEFRLSRPQEGAFPFTEW